MLGTCEIGAYLDSGRHFLNDGYREGREVKEEECSKYYCLYITRVSVFPEGVALPDNRKNVDPRKLLQLEAKNVYRGKKDIYL